MVIGGGVLLAYLEQRKPSEVEARNVGHIPSIIPYFDITEVLIPNFSLQERAAQELQERAYREGKLILGVRPLCWDTGDFALFLHDLRNATILLQPFSLTKDSPRDRQRIAYRLRAVVPEVVRTLLLPEPPPAAGPADGVAPVPAPRFRR